MPWEELTNRYKESGVVLALGAGVSIGAGLPNWKQLLERLAAEFDAAGRLLEYEKLIQNGLTLPIIASIFEEYSSGRNEFVEKVRKALYGTFPFFQDGVSKSNRRKFVRYVKESNPTLHAVATICAVSNGDTGRLKLLPRRLRSQERSALAAEPLSDPAIARRVATEKRRAARRYEPNPLIRGIVTFNLDAVLQAYVYARFEKRLLRTIERASASSIAGKINIYHMHGFLRFDQSAGDFRKEAPDTVVLTEQDYFNFFNDPTSLFNYTFLYLLREATCLFIGLSMQDENIRRMLHLSKLERVRALRSEGVSASDARAESLRHFAILQHNRVSSVDKAIEDSLLPLGTRVLWVDEWVEIPQRLRVLYESTRNDWSIVS